MSGLKIVVPTTFTDPTLPVLRDDPILPASGALMLLEPGHPANPLVGVPASGATIPNIAYEQAKALIPAGDATTLAAKQTVGSTFDAEGKRERSSKGGLHYITSQATAGAATRNVIIEAPTLIQNWLAVTNPAHKYFLSMWLRITRMPTAPGTGGIPQHAFYGALPSNTQVFRFYERSILTTAGDTEYPTDARRTGYRRVNLPVAALGPVFHNIGIENVNGVTPSGNITLVNVGNNGMPTGDWGKVSSFVFYRFYLEDLTASGRTYAQVDALDIAEFNKQVVNAGGRYYGDTTPTNPATIP